MEISVMGNAEGKKRKVVLPFLNASFGTNLQIIFVFWPLWWILGVEQFVPIFFLVWEAARYVVLNKGRFRLHPSNRWAIFLAIWWIVPIGLVEREHLDIFLKELTTAWAQALILLLFWNAIRTSRDWYRVGSGLVAFTIYQVLGSFVFILGIHQQPVTSFFGEFLPSSLIESSAFFKSISVRSLGAYSVESAIFPFRVSGLQLNIGGMSMICLLMMPFIFWQILLVSGFVGAKPGQTRKPRLVNSRLWLLIGGILIWSGLFVTLLFTESRIAYLAFAVGFMLFVVLHYRLLSSSNRILFYALLALSFALLIVTGLVAFGELIDLLRTTFVETRGSSWATRLTIYRETLRLLNEHIFIGWGQPLRIEGLRSVYSAGTHSSYLGMLFQHGLVGLILYLGLWLSIWRIIVRGLRNYSNSLSARYLWIMMAVAMVSFNVRETADSWWWDLSVSMTIWALWGLIITAPKVLWLKNGTSPGKLRD